MQSSVESTNDKTAIHQSRNKRIFAKYRSATIKINQNTNKYELSINFFPVSRKKFVSRNESEFFASRSTVKNSSMFGIQIICELFHL